MTEEIENEMPQNIGPFKVLKKIGQGAFSTVYKGIHEQTMIEVAIKVINKKQFEQDNLTNRLVMEINLLKQMDHPMINQLYYIEENDDFVYIVMEYSQNGDLLSFVNNNGKLIEPIARRYFVQLFSVIEYLHKEKKVAHRDLKAENILLDQYFNIRVIDFGLSRCFESENCKFDTKCGSPAYVPPEMILGKGYSTNADTWSAGIILYAMTVGRLPFDDENVQKTLQLIITAQPQLPPSLSPALTDLIIRMLTKDPASRISLDKIKEHPWFSRLEYNAITTYLKKLEEVKCDPEIVSQMESLGIDTKSLRQNLFMGLFDETTAIYRMLRKVKVTQEMKTAMRARPMQSNATPQPSKIGKSIIAARPGRVIERKRPESTRITEEEAKEQKQQFVRPVVIRAVPQRARRVQMFRSNSVKPPEEQQIPAMLQ